MTALHRSSAKLPFHPSAPEPQHFSEVSAEETRSARPGRPKTLTPGLLAGMAAFIRMEGISDSAAGLLAGVSTSTLSRWKQEDEEVAIALGQARALYELERARTIRQMMKPDGTVDWRAQAWLLQHSSPENYGTPSRRRQARAQREMEERRAEQDGREESQHHAERTTPPVPRASAPLECTAPSVLGTDSASPNTSPVVPAQPAAAAVCDHRAERQPANNPPFSRAHIGATEAAENVQIFPETPLHPPQLSPSQAHAIHDVAPSITPAAQAA